MAMYSAHQFNVLLKADTPEVILSLLRAMGEGEGEEYAEAAMLDGEFFLENRWSSLFMYGTLQFDDYFAEKQKFFELKQQIDTSLYKLTVKSANACHAAEQFLRMLEPYIANAEGETIGESRYEETYLDYYKAFKFVGGKVDCDVVSLRTDDDWPGGFG